MQSTCLLCCEESQIWVLPPCNHNQICWKCCLKLVEGSIFSCPFCKSKPQTKSQLLFVTTEEMNSKDFKTIMQNNPFRSNKNSFYYYSNQKVANYIEAQTSFHCTVCAQVHQNLNLLKKHLYSLHRVQFCDVCLDNRRCMIGQQKLYSDHQLLIHMKEGETSPTGQIVLYHPNCQFCSRRFYDLDMFKIHLKMSSHLKCEICEINSKSLKYIYYRNFQELQRHHKKSHFVCEVGECIGRKMENVFASENLLEEHKRRFHRKYRPEKQQKLDNILLGFNKKEEEQLIDFDGIGKNISHEFTIFERHDSVQKQKHEDLVIDLREFYPEIVKANLHPKIDDIVNKLDQLQSREGKGKQPNFAQLPLYKPLEMTNLNKHECERMVRRSFPPKDAEIIIQLFFIKRFEFRSPEQSYIALEKKMRVYSNFAFFIIFPQLIRNLKPQNRGKVVMDQFYASRLRTLAVNRMFIFHGVERYSNLVDYTRCEVEQEVRVRLQRTEIDLQVYARYLKQMNTKYYFDQQEGIYLVNSQKMTHLYHMVERCPTKQLLKMNWLLKVGLSISSYNLLGKFYYFTKEELTASNRVFQSLTLQELALLYAYLTICKIALVDETSFQSFKKNPKPHYLTNILDQFSQPPKISNRQILELKSLEGHSDALNKKNYEHRVRGLIINENDCPSLLAPIQCKQIRSKPQQMPKVEDILGRSLLPTPWNQNQARKKKKPPMERGNHEEEFPTLGGGSGGKNRGPGKGSVVEKKIVQPEQEEQFPVFSFNQKFVNHKLPAKQQKESQVNNFVNFNNKAVSKQFWDEHRTRKKFQTIQTEKELFQKKAAEEREFMRKQAIVQKQSVQRNENIKIKEINGSKRNKKQIVPIKEYQEEQDQYLRLAIQQSLKTAKMEEYQRQQNRPSKVEIIQPKKNIYQQLDESQTKKKKRREKKVEPQPPQNNSKPQIKQELTLFERIELQQKKAKRSPFRRDISPKKNISEVQKSFGSLIQKQEKSYLTNSRGPIFEDDDFLPIGMTSNTPQQQSIVTRLIKQSQAREQISEAPKKQKNKKKKNRRDQSP